MNKTGSFGDSTEATATCCPQYVPGWESLMLKLLNLTIMIAVSLFGIGGNVLSLLVFSSFKNLTSTFIYLRALAAFDICVILSVGLFSHRYAYPLLIGCSDSTVTGGTLAIAVLPLSYTAATASTWTVVMVSVDRYLQVCRSQTAKGLCTVEASQKRLVLVFVASILYNIPRIFEYYPMLSHPEIIDTCTGYFHVPRDSLGANPVYLWLYSVVMYVLLMYVVPLGILIFVNIHLVRAVRLQKELTARLHAKGSNPPAKLYVSPSTTSTSGNYPHKGVCTVKPVSKRKGPPKSMASLKRHNAKKKYDQVTLQLVAISALYAFCQAFDMILQFLWRLNHPVAPYYSIWAYDLVVVNSSVNVIIYSVGCLRFRRKMVSVLRQLVPSWLESSGQTTSCTLTRSHIQHRPSIVSEDGRVMGSCDI